MTRAACRHSTRSCECARACAAMVERDKPVCVGLCHLSLPDNGVPKGGEAAATPIQSLPFPTELHMHNNDLLKTIDCISISLCTLGN